MMETNKKIKTESEGASFAPRRPKTRKTCCAVQNCRSRSDRDLGLSFHTFPRKQCKLLEAWKTATGIKTVKLHTTVCSRHFTKDNYFFPEAPSKRRVLKKTAVPSCNLPGATDETEDSQCETHKTSNETIFEEEQPMEIKQEAVECYDEIVSEDTSLDKENDTEFVKVEICEESVADKMETLVKSEDIRFFDFLKSDSQLSTATGIETFQILKCIVDLATTTAKTTVNGNACDMSLQDKIVMTYVKLKQNLSYPFLAVMFNCHTANDCALVFKDTLRLLSSSLKLAIPWPSKEEISRTLPICFRDFENVRVVLKATKFFIQNSSKFCCETATYCKHSESVKIMTAATPAGNIAFVSKLYSGRASDEVIFKNSEIVNMLETGDDVMVDGGFLIDDICEANQWKCIRPPVLRGNKRQFSKEEAILAANIAKARVHVDRSNEKIKQFKIVADELLTNDLVPFVEEIVTVICGTVNLSSPTMEDYKFMAIA